MTITIGGFSSSFLLQQQPIGYDGNAEDGLTARKWTIAGILTATQAAALLGVYDTWRNTRITDADTFASGTVGTTVALTIASDAGSVTALSCWFLAPPTVAQLGNYTSVTVELVDAAQKLAVLLRTREKQRQSSEAEVPDLGTFTLGSAVIDLIEAPDTYQDTPQLTLTPAGVHRVTGPLVATRVKNLRGYLDTTGWTNLRSWYETVITTSPAAGVWFPVTEPTAEAEVIISGGVKATRYTVSVSVAEVR